MAVTSGFFNSVNSDRKYSAEQFGSIFDGVITDGVFYKVGNLFAVTAGTGMSVNVASGRAWFNSSWILNNGVVNIPLTTGEPILNRIDAIVIEINKTVQVRSASIKVVKGTPATNPVRPTMTNTELVNQHPLAFVTVPAKSTSVSNSNIASVIGTYQCPFVTSVVQVTNIDTFINQMDSLFDDFIKSETSDYNKWSTNLKNDFNAWYASIKATLSDDVAYNLTMQVNRREPLAEAAEYILNASSWSSGTYNFEGTYPYGSYDLDISLSTSATMEQIFAFSDAILIADKTQNKIYAKGAVPTINIPIILGVRRKV